MKTVKRYFVDRINLPNLFPTHAHPPEFWEQLGRSVASYGFLEKVLKQAIFVLEGTQIYREDEIQDAYAKWAKDLEKTLGGQLGYLADKYERAIRGNRASTLENVDQQVDALEEAAKIRNILCHASWDHPPDAEGKSLPFFFSKRLGVCETAVDIQFLRQVQEELRELTCDVIDTTTQMGYTFPGSNGPGETMWPHQQERERP